MIKALMLIFSPMPTWDRAVTAQRRWPVIFFAHTLPLLLFTAAMEGYGLLHWGKSRGEIFPVKKFSVRETVIFESFEVIALVMVLFFAAGLIKNLASTFRGGRTFTQAFTVTAYGLSPLFLMRLLDVIPDLWPGVSWAIGIMLSAAVLYHGLPRVMQPELPQAFGFFLSSVLLLAFVTGLVQFIAAMYLVGKFGRVETLISQLGVQP
jgi:hypothetical protein